MYMAQVLSQGNEEADKREEMVMSRDSWAAGGSHSTRSKRARAPCQRSYSILAEDGGGGGSFELRLSCLLVAGDGCQRCLRTEVTSNAPQVTQPNAVSFSSTRSAVNSAEKAASLNDMPMPHQSLAAFHAIARSLSPPAVPVFAFSSLMSLSSRFASFFPLPRLMLHLSHVWCLSVFLCPPLSRQ